MSIRLEGLGTESAQENSPCGLSGELPKIPPIAGRIEGAPLNRILVSFVTLLTFQTAVFGRTESKITVGRNPDFVAVNSATNTIYSSNSSEGTVSVVDGATNTRTATISVAGFPQGIAANSATNQVYVALFNGLDSKVAVIDGGTNTVVTSIAVPGAVYVAVDAATNRIYTSDSDNTVRVIDGASNSVIAEISFDDVLEELAVDATRNLIYVAVVGATAGHMGHRWNYQCRSKYISQSRKR